MKWFGRSKKKETVNGEAKHPAKLKKDDETVSEKTTTKPNTQKIETENTDSISKKLQLVFNYSTYDLIADLIVKIQIGSFILHIDHSC